MERQNLKKSVSGEIQLECATVLDKLLTGESSLRLRIYCPNLGLALLVKRVSSKKTTVLPDIFDDISLTARVPSMGDVLFPNEYETLTSRMSLSKDYGAFLHASEICALVIKNGAHIENANRLHARIRGALDSMANGALPETVHLKFLYLLVRDEGYPVHEDFLKKFSGSQKAAFCEIISTPPPKRKDAPGGDSEPRLRGILEGSTAFLEALSNWAIRCTDIIL